MAGISQNLNLAATLRESDRQACPRIIKSMIGAVNLRTSTGSFICQRLKVSLILAFI
jgi:hypothetical protein